MSEKEESIGDFCSRMWQGFRETFGRLTVFDFVVWPLFVMWCVIESPTIQRHAVAMARAGNLRTGDLVWNLSHDIFPFVAAFGIAVLTVRLLNRINRWMK